MDIGLEVTSALERVAHRGSPRERLENTLPGFQLALEHGADAVELDVHVTSDGTAVVHHDESARGIAIAAARWDELRELDLGDGATMPRLDDVLRAIGDRAAVYVELKGREIERIVLEIVRAHGRRVALHSFDHDAIVRVAELAPKVPRGILLDRGVTNPVQALRRSASRTHPRDVWPHWSLVNEQFVRAAHELGVRVIAWTVNSTDTARHLAELGVDGICTDDVRLLANL